MSYTWSLAHLTALSLDPPALIEAAHRTGCQHVGLRLDPLTPQEPHFPLIADADMLAKTQRRLRSTGVTVHDVEVIRLGSQRPPESYLDFLRTAAELGATHLVTQTPDTHGAEATDLFGRMCDLAAAFGMRCDLEFVTWTAVPDLSTAAEIVGSAGRTNAGILIDFLHFDRSGCSLEDLRALPREWFTWAHVNDAPGHRPHTTEELIRAAREHRLIPGQGDIDLHGILNALPPDITLALEAPHTAAVEALGASGYIEHLVQQARAHLTALSAPVPGPGTAPPVA
jgi:sugar phosphate isomerase/epimerase